MLGVDSFNNHRCVKRVISLDVHQVSLIEARGHYEPTVEGHFDTQLVDKLYDLKL